MYAPNSVLILITTLSAGALAFPTAETSMLHVRSATKPVGLISTMPGSIAGYPNDQCTGDPVSGDAAPDGTTVLPNPLCQGTCITFNTPADIIGIDYGSFGSMRAYSDPHCKSELPYVTRPNLTTYTEIQSCVNQQRTFGGMIGSINFFVTDDARPVDSAGRTFQGTVSIPAVTRLYPSQTASP